MTIKHVQFTKYVAEIRTGHYLVGFSESFDLVPEVTHDIADKECHFGSALTLRSFVKHNKPDLKYTTLEVKFTYEVEDYLGD